MEFNKMLMMSEKILAANDIRYSKCMRIPIDLQYKDISLADVVYMLSHKKQARDISYLEVCLSPDGFNFVGLDIFDFDKGKDVLINPLEWQCVQDAIKILVFDLMSEAIPQYLEKRILEECESWKI